MGGPSCLTSWGTLNRVGIAGGKAGTDYLRPAFDYAARYAPDGKLIVFCSGPGRHLNLWLANATDRLRGR